MDTGIRKLSIILFIFQLLSPLAVCKIQSPQIQRTGPHTWKIKQHAFSSLSTPAENLLGRDVAETPFLTGEAPEIRLIRIYPGSLLSQAGFSSGDRIIGINGFEISGFWSTLGVIREISKQNRPITIQLVRKGKTLFQVYLFEGDSFDDLSGILLKELMRYIQPV